MRVSDVGRRFGKLAVVFSLAAAPIGYAGAQVGIAPAEGAFTQDRQDRQAPRGEFRDTSNGMREAPTNGSLALAALDRKIADLDAEENAAKKELSELAGKLAVQKKKSIAQGRAYYRMTRAGMLPAGGGVHSFLQWAMRVERAKKNIRFDVAEERRLSGRGAELAKTLERVAKDRSQLASQRSAMDAARYAIADESRRSEAFDRAFAGSGEFIAVNGENGASSGFSAARGHLLFPVAVRANARVARREGTNGPGVEIATPANTVVRAVYAGRVAFADRYGPYGRLVILDHGDHYYTVTGNLATIDVRIGDELVAGERLGIAGDEGRGPMVYFEVRHRTETLPPATWLGLNL
jgi:murein DD-endopeptidase MepM/ murein hydrolase activator NlpD